MMETNKLELELELWNGRQDFPHLIWQLDWFFQSVKKSQLGKKILFYVLQVYEFFFFLDHQQTSQHLSNIYGQKELPLIL